MTITKNGRAHTVLISAAFFKMMTKGRVARMVEDLDDDTLGAIAGNAVPDEFAHLGQFLKD